MFIVPAGVALIITFRGSYYRCLEQIVMVPKGFEPSKFDCMLTEEYYLHSSSKNHGQGAIFGTKIIKPFSCSSQLSMKFVLLINLKLLPTANSFLLNIAEHIIFSATKYDNVN